MARYALKYDSEFLVADALGDITGEGDGLYFNDTRLLSPLALTFGGATPSLLSSGVSQDNVFFRSNLTNRPLPELGERAPPEGALYVERTRFLWDRRLYERIAITNYALREIPLKLRIAFAADFADIFEVRGHVRSRHGRMLEPELRDAEVKLAYEGVDAVV